MKFKLINDFKEFAVKGNMIDIAIGVIIGTAFNKVVDVLVKEVFLPPLSLLTGSVKLTNKKIILRNSAMEEGDVIIDEIAIGYGKLLEASVDFLIIAFTVFVVVKVMNSIRNKAQDPKDNTVVTPKEIELLSRITELMEKQIEITEANKK